MEDLIRVKYYFKEHPNTTLSVFLKTQEQVEAYKSKHTPIMFILKRVIKLWIFLKI
jgi:hypothetical protein